jgi:hypothetical protein
MTATETFAAIMAAGHFDAAVRPGPHDESRILPSQLDDFMRRNTVRLRGWPVPFIDNHYPVSRHGSWIGQEHASPRHQEAWRLFTSGQFLHRRVMVSDLVKQGDLAPQVSSATGSVVVWDVLLYAVELVELAARFCTDLDTTEVAIELGLVNIAGRELVSGAWERELHGPYLIEANRLDAKRRVTSLELLGDTRGIAVSIVQKLLGHFGLNIPDQVLIDWQEQVFTRR